MYYAYIHVLYCGQLELSLSHTHTESLRSELITSGAVPALVDCLTFTDTSVQYSSAQALGMLSCDSEARSQLLASNGIPPLLSCLQSPNSQLVQTTSWTLAIAAQSTEVAETVCQLGYVSGCTIMFQSLRTKNLFGEILFHKESNALACTINHSVVWI